jgi:2-hydroxychromene-2-carboxylate isomerase
MLTVDLYWAFRSPYSYLAILRLMKLRSEFDMDIRVRHVYPLVMRRKGVIAAADPVWVSYVVKDAPRVAEFQGVPFRWPKPDPLVQDMKTLRLADDQPYIRRLTRMGQAATNRGRGMEFAYEVARLLWGGTRGWHEGDHLRRATELAGLDLTELDKEVARDPEKFERQIEINQAELDTAGHWGVPTMVFEGEPFFGQDRIDLLIWRMTQRGLKRREQSWTA